MTHESVKVLIHSISVAFKSIKSLMRFLREKLIIKDNLRQTNEEFLKNGKKFDLLKHVSTETSVHDPQLIQVQSDES